MKRTTLFSLLTLIVVAVLCVLLTACGKSPEEVCDDTDIDLRPATEGLSFAANDDGTYTVTGMGIATDTDIVIPAVFNDKSVTLISDDAFYNCDRLTSVIIGGNVKNIGEYAFGHCSNLLSVTVSASVTGIGEQAFSDCDKLIEVVNKSQLKIPRAKNSSDGIDYYLKNDPTGNGYLNCTALKVKKCGKSDIVNVDGYLFYTYEKANYLVGYAGNDTELTLPDNYDGKSYEIYKRAFRNCGALTSVTIPDGVTLIDEDAFRNCGALTSVTIGNGVKGIRNAAFYNCVGLTSVTMGSNVDYLENSVFESCGALTSVTIPESVTSIGNFVFYSCGALERVNFNGTQGEWNAIKKGDDRGLEVPETCKVYCTDGIVNI